MWGDHVFICVFHWRTVCREKKDGGGELRMRMSIKLLV